MATRAYIVDITDENTAEMISNNFDGGEHLNKALNQNQIDPDDIFPAIGDIRAIDLETGDVERYKEGGTIIVRGEDIDDTMQRVIDKFQTGGVNYLQVYNRMDRSWNMIKKSTFDRALGELVNIVKIKNEAMKENYESKWKNFLNESDDQLSQDYFDIENRIKLILKDEGESEVNKYLETVKNDFDMDFHDGIERYYQMEREDIIDDFDNYITNDLDI
tara:strand:+ start:663 stop:1316 length:654 start_codon:yes stop_codon:yes gene_type:complete